MSKPNLCKKCQNYEKQIVFRGQAWTEQAVCLYNRPQRGAATACKDYEEKDSDETNAAA
jgi:hypothetical protein